MYAMLHGTVTKSKKERIYPYNGWRCVLFLKFQQL